MTAPTTTAIPTGWRARFDPRPSLARVQGSGIAITQIVVAATLSFIVAHYVVGHPAPLLAGTVTVSSLGLVRDARPRRVFETVLGMLLGILIAEALVLVAGAGWWQLAIAVSVTLVVARFISPQPAFAIAAAIQSIIVIVVPAQAPFLRLIDGAIGGAAALAVTALIPRNPLRVAIHDGVAVFDALDSAAATIVQGLRRADRGRAERGLEKARALQPVLDDWRASLESGLSIARISPWLRRHRFELERFDRIRTSAELASRNLRVIARRALYQCDDGQPRPVVADLLSDIVRAQRLIADGLSDIAAEPQARASLLAVAAHLDPREVLPDASLGDQNLVASLRPYVVDLLTAAGVAPADARAAVPRI